MLDCDPGIDDALAVLFLLGSAKVDVKAIVATFGNVGLNQTKRNLLRILGLFEPPPNPMGAVRIPLIGSGSRGPLRHKARRARHVHGQDGLADCSDVFGRKHPAGFKNGIDLIINLALSNKIDRIIATGPLTDLARAFKKRPAILENLKEVVIMGGAVFVKGNVTPYAEFNFHCDPEADRIVLSSGVIKKLVSLDVTQKTLLRPAHLRRIKNIKGPIARFIYHIADYTIYSNRKRGLDGAPMHDPLAAAKPHLAVKDKNGVEARTGGARRGMVAVKKGRPNILFCKKVNTGKFFDLFLGALTKLASPVR